MKSNGNGDVLKYIVKLLLKNFEEPFIYELASEEIDRLKDFLPNIHQKEVKRFFCFESMNNINVAVSIPDVQLVHFLWEKASHQNIEDEEVYRESSVSFYFRHKAVPYTSDFDENADAALLFSMLDSFDDEIGFFSFIDIDGEQVSFRLNELTLVEFDSKVLNSGFDELNAEPN